MSKDEVVLRLKAFTVVCESERQAVELEQAINDLCLQKVEDPKQIFYTWVIDELR